MPRDEDIELQVTPQELPDLQPLLKWADWKIFNNKPTTRLQQIAGGTGLITGALSAAVTYNLATLVGKLLAKQINASSTGARALEVFLSVGTIIPRVALGSIYTQDAFAELASYLEQKNHLPRKKNRPHLRRVVDVFANFGNGCLGLMGVYIHLHYLQAPKEVKYAFLPFVYVCNHYTTQVVFNQKINMAFAYFSPGKTDRIIQMRAELNTQLKMVLKAIFGMQNSEFEVLFHQMTQDGLSTAEKIKTLFAVREATPSTERNETWQEKCAGAFGFIGAALSTYAGTVPLSFKMAEWICKAFGIDDEESKQCLGVILSMGSYIPYTVLTANAAQIQFKNIIRPWVTNETIHTPAKTANPGMRKNLARAAPILGTISAVPNSFWAFTLIKSPFGIALGVLSLMVPGALYTKSIKELFSRSMNFYESMSGDAETVLQHKFLADIANLSTVINELPDETVAAMHAHVSVPNNPAVSQLITPQRSQQEGCGGFFNRTIHPTPEAGPSYWDSFKRSVFPGRL